MKIVNEFYDEHATELQKKIIDILYQKSRTLEFRQGGDHSFLIG